MFILSKSSPNYQAKHQCFLCKILYLLSIVVFNVSCDNGTQTIEIKWDRDACEHCRMVISDKHFAAQIRGGAKNKVYLFDDIGCAVHWLPNQSWGKEKSTKIWVANYRNGNWLNARTAYYIPGQTTPMDFGFGAVRELVAGSVNFEIAKAQLLAKKRRHLH